MLATGEFAMRQSLLVLAILGCLSVAAAAQPLPVSDHYFTTTDGMKLHYAKLGKTGSPVILIHGSGGAARTWLENGVAQALAKNHIVIVANMRGHGLSQGPRDGDMPLDVIELMDQLKIERAHIHGFSMGGSILAQLMARVPQRIITAVFGGSGVREPEDLAAKVPPDAKGTDPDTAKIRALYTLRQEERAKLDEEHRKQGLTGPEPGARPGPGRTELDLTKITFPVLAIVGEFDSPNARTHRLWRELRNFQIIRLPGKEHLTSVYPGTIPKEYIEGLVRFIDANDIARSAS
jgi:pimeloyl-ACP methyl ester carboxylesterase